MTRTHCRSGHELAVLGTHKGGRCAECARARARAWREANLERARAYNRAYNRAYRDANPERVRESNRAYRDANPERVRAWHEPIRDIRLTAKGTRCWDCGGEFERCDLHFHHRDPATKLFGVGRGRPSEVKLRAEIAKCDVLCVTCHVAAHRAMGKVSA